uniref:Uncharacterized protein ycf18 n=1 Tax=Polysiphonia sertularioides TaxID=945028 RepID=A0A1Z1M905_9FLOR|nr:phycobilisome degradation protein [Polysiphonia sertularioides]ARW62449.1 phycobilisome degradation protein [Polysiphonia sertularioides]
MKQLNLEQEFRIIIYDNKIKKFSKSQVKKYLLKTLERMVIKDNLIKYFVKKSIN